jgi:hypothetical protein
VDCTAENLLEHLLILAMKSRGLSQIPFIWFWPDGARNCAIMTHDVETAAGLNFCERLIDLNDSFDMSIPNVARLDPQRGGCCTVLPFFIGDIVELPVTTTEGYSLFHILGDYSGQIEKTVGSPCRSALAG